MLRIIRIVGSGGVETLRLEGKFLEPWVDEVREAYALSKAQAAYTCLDLSALTFVDAAGVNLLRVLIQGGVEIVASSSYVAELLRIG